MCVIKNANKEFKFLRRLSSARNVRFYRDKNNKKSFCPHLRLISTFNASSSAIKVRFYPCSIRWISARYHMHHVYLIWTTNMHLQNNMYVLGISLLFSEWVSFQWSAYIFSATIFLHQRNIDISIQKFLSSFRYLVTFRFNAFIRYTSFFRWPYSLKGMLYIHDRIYKITLNYAHSYEGYQHVYLL